jgi:hypothetical protein
MSGLSADVFTGDLGTVSAMSVSTGGADALDEGTGRMSTHTAGPWERAWRWSGFDIVADGPPIAHIHFGHDIKGATANSHLIAAAPDLLVALKAAWAECDKEQGADVVGVLSRLGVPAIAKAEGRVT